MSGLINKWRDFFGCKMKGAERIFLFLVLPIALVSTAAVLYFWLKPPSVKKFAKAPQQNNAPLASPPRLDPQQIINALESAEQMEKTGSPEAIEAARKAYEDLAASNPENDRVWGGLGRCLLAQKKFEESRRALDRACRLNVVRPEHFAARGSARRALGDLRGALTDYTDALHLKPIDPLVSNRMLLVAIQKENEQLYFLKLGGISKSRGNTPDATWVVGAAAKEMMGGNFFGAAGLLKQAETLLPAGQLQAILDDPVFASRRGEEFLRRYRAGEFAVEAPSPSKEN